MSEQQIITILDLADAYAVARATRGYTSDKEVQDARAALESALRAGQEAQEPVAWFLNVNMYNGKPPQYEQVAEQCIGTEDTFPLYASPVEPCLALKIHYPDCWDVASYPTLQSAINEIVGCAGCSTCNPVRVESAPEWMPIDSAPKDGTPLLGCFWDPDLSEHYSPLRIYWAAYHPNATGKICWRDSPITGNKLERITHFMPLPAAPEVVEVAK